MRPARFLVVACGGTAGAAARWGANLWAASTAKAAACVATTLILGIGAAAAGLVAAS